MQMMRLMRRGMQSGEIDAFAPIRVANLERSAARDYLVFDQADAVGHGQSEAPREASLIQRLSHQTRQSIALYAVEGQRSAAQQRHNLVDRLLISQRVYRSEDGQDLSIAWAVLELVGKAMWWWSSWSFSFLS